MFTMVKEWTTLTAYCNWIEQGSATFNPPSVSTGLYLWKLSTGSARFDGKQKDPIFWDRALSDIEVQELYYSSKII